MAIENSNLSIEELSLIEGKIESNIAIVSDYEKLDYFLSTIGSPNYLLQRFRKHQINSYEEFIVERKKKENKDSAVNGILIRNVFGAINILKSYVLKEFE